MIAQLPARCNAHLPVGGLLDVLLLRRSVAAASAAASAAGGRGLLGSRLLLRLLLLVNLIVTFLIVQLQLCAEGQRAALAGERSSGQLRVGAHASDQQQHHAQWRTGQVRTTGNAGVRERVGCGLRRLA